MRSVVIILGLILSLPLQGQQSLDRTKIPPPGKTPMLRVPAWTKSKLANGADLIVSEKHDLPLVARKPMEPVSPPMFVLTVVPNN